jgi:hypothetical protein
MAGDGPCRASSDVRSTAMTPKIRRSFAARSRFCDGCAWVAPRTDKRLEGRSPPRSRPAEDDKISANRWRILLECERRTLMTCE